MKKDIQDSPYHPFNSMKVMLWRKHLEGMTTGNLLPPVTVDFDPTNKCNSGCIWCNSLMFRQKHPDTMDTDHMIELANFYGKWGIRSACVAGGGEPTLNPGTAEALYAFSKNLVKTGFITNGIEMTEEQMKSIVDNCSWCGFSIDAGNRKAFKAVHQVDKFDQVIQNLKTLIEIKKERKSNVEITYKFLLHPLNARTIYDGAVLAKNIGCDMVQCRPVCWDNLYDQTPRQPIDYKKVIYVINNEMEQAEYLTNDKFKFYGIRHKFGDNMERIVNFKKCRATPIMAVYCADGTVQMCHDLRGKEEWILCRHDDPYEILKVWGSKKHLDMIDSINPKECPRCTFQRYNEIIEQVIIEDKMYKDFP